MSASILKEEPILNIENFIVHVDGQIKSADFGAQDDLYCGYSFSLGHDWLVSSVSDVYNFLLN